MKHIHRMLIVFIALSASVTRAAEPAWQKMTDPSAAEVAAKWANPPAEYCHTIMWGWNGEVSRETIVRDMSTIHARGFRVMSIEAGYRMKAQYLSSEWFDLIRFACEEAKKRDMRIVLIDDGKYPSGFVNGKYTRERPDLRMQALVGAGREQVAGGQAFEKDVAENVVSAIAFKTDGSASVPLQITGGKIKWAAPEGQWEVVIVAHDFRTPQTRAVSDPNGAKTTVNSMGDLLHPEATRLFIEWTHEQYKKHVGDYFGSTIIGFRGDEPEMTGIPWTAAIVEEFKRAKGYDVTPYLASFVVETGGGGRGRGRGGDAAAGPATRAGQAGATAIRVSDEQRRAKADYYDVWAELFARNFFDTQADWCEANGILALTHLNNDHNIPSLVRTTGDFYRALRKTQMPGVDVIWSQIYPGRGPADFPKFASSASHLYGRPRALSETFAAYYDPVTMEVARFGFNHLAVRGINMLEFMSMRSTAPNAASPAPAPPANPGGRATIPSSGNPYMTDAKVTELTAYANRIGYVLSQGRPVAHIGVYVPTMSMWMGDNTGNAAMMTIADQLLSQQRDFEFVDDQSLAAGMKLDGGAFVNASGQSLRAIIVPTSTAISKAALTRLQGFAKAGGKVVFIGRTPSIAVDKTFLKSEGPGDLSWAILEPSGEVTAKVLEALPKADVMLETASAPVKVMHRKWRDADVYFFFNESDQKQASAAAIQGSGRAQVWDAQSATITTVPGATVQNGIVRFPLELAGYEAKLVVIGPAAMATR